MNRNFRQVIAILLLSAAFLCARFALADPPTDPQKQIQDYREALASWKIRCAGVNSAGRPDWCVQERARLDAIKKALNIQDDNSQGNQQ
jgi:hypothetical protein